MQLVDAPDSQASVSSGVRGSSMSTALPFWRWHLCLCGAQHSATAAESPGGFLEPHRAQAASPRTGAKEAAFRWEAEQPQAHLALLGIAVRMLSSGSEDRCLMSSLPSMLFSPVLHLLLLCGKRKLSSSTQLLCIYGNISSRLCFIYF